MKQQRIISTDDKQLIGAEKNKLLFTAKITLTAAMSIIIATLLYRKLTLYPHQTTIEQHYKGAQTTIEQPSSQSQPTPPRKSVSKPHIPTEDEEFQKKTWESTQSKGWRTLKMKSQARWDAVLNKIVPQEKMPLTNKTSKTIKNPKINPPQEYTSKFKDVKLNSFKKLPKSQYTKIMPISRYDPIYVPKNMPNTPSEAMELASESIEMILKDLQDNYMSSYPIKLTFDISALTPTNQLCAEIKKIDTCIAKGMSRTFGRPN